MHSKETYDYYRSKKFFDESYAIVYDQWEKNPWLNYVQKRQQITFSKLLDIKKNETLLDIGSGTGKYLKLFANHCKIAIGIDYSKDMIIKASKNLEGKYSNIHLMVGDAEYLPIKERAVDKAIAVNTLQYLNNDLACMSEIRRVIRKSAVLDGVCRTELRFVYPLFYIINYINKKLGKLAYGPYRNYYSVRSLINRSRTSGLIPQRISGASFNLPHFGKCSALPFTIPSPSHIMHVFPSLFNLFNKLEEKYAEGFLKSLCTHLILLAEKNENL